MVPALSGRVGTDTALIEREYELELIDGLLREASEGRGVLALAEGEAGVGKSALLATARTRARSAGLTVLAARGHDAESAFAFGGCLQLFEPVLAKTRSRERLLVGAADLASPLLDAARAETRADRAAARSARSGRSPCGRS